MTTAQLSKAVTAAIQEGLDKGLPPSVAVEQAWAKVKVPSELYASVRKTVWVEIGKMFSLEANDLQNIWSRLDDATVRKYIARASTRMRVKLETEIVKSMKSGESIRAAAIRIGASSDPQQVRKDLRSLSKNPITSKQAQALDQKIRAGIKGDALRAQYQELIKASEDPERFKKQLKYAMQEVAKSQAERVMRTETERAYYAAKTEQIAKDPDVKLVRIRTQSRHTHCDICNTVAEADMGYGPGVYELGKAPSLPLHPNCGCRLQAIYTPKGIQKTSAEDAIGPEANNIKFTRIK